MFNTLRPMTRPLTPSEIAQGFSRKNVSTNHSMIKASDIKAAEEKVNALQDGLTKLFATSLLKTLKEAYDKYLRVLQQGKNLYGKERILTHMEIEAAGRAKLEVAYRDLEKIIQKQNNL